MRGVFGPIDACEMHARVPRGRGGCCKRAALHSGRSVSPTPPPFPLHPWVITADVGKFSRLGGRRAGSLAGLEVVGLEFGFFGAYRVLSRSSLLVQVTVWPTLILMVAGLN